MPMLVWEACKATGTVSNTVYYQHAVCAALARDLGLDYDELLSRLPAPKGPAGHLFDPTGTNHPLSRYAKPVAPQFFIEEVR